LIDANPARNERLSRPLLFGPMRKVKTALLGALAAGAAWGCFPDVRLGDSGSGGASAATSSTTSANGGATAGTGGSGGSPIVGKLTCGPVTLSFGAPEEVATTQTTPHGLIAANKKIFWIDSPPGHEWVWTMDPNVPSKPFKFLSDSDGVNALAVNVNALFYSQTRVVQLPGSGAIRVGDLPSDTNDKQVYSNTKGGVSALQLSGGLLYFLNTDNGGNTIWTLMPGGSAAYLGGGGSPKLLAVQGKHVFHANGANVHRIPKNNPTSEQIVAMASGTLAATSLTADDKLVLWTNGAGEVRGRDVELSLPAFVLADGQSAATGIVSDGVAAYWYTGDGSVWAACAKPNSTPLAIAQHEGAIHSLAFDDKGVYWSADTADVSHITRVKRK
jgi:hypothetical protein